MATDLATPSNTTAKVRWHEQYVSEGINKKLNGIIPAGVVRGGKLGTSIVNLSVTIEADPVTGDSIYSYIDATGHQVTFRQVGDITLDLSGVVSTIIFIGLEVTYVISVDTVVKWRAFSQAEIDADPSLVVLGMVDVPAAGIIPASDIYPTERREAWTTIAPHIREWRNPITNGSFETCLAAVLTGATDDYFPDWDVDGSYGFFNGVTVSVVTGGARTGDRALQVVLSGAASERMRLYWAGQLKVFAGQLMSASVWVKANALSPGPGANGVFGLQIEFLTRDGGFAGLEVISDISLSGTFDWTEIAGIVEVPSNAVSAWFFLYYNDDNQNSTGTITFDDVRVFLETGRPTDEYPGDGRDDHFGGSLRALSLDIPPEPPTPGDIDDLVSEMIRIRQNGKLSGVLQLLMGARDGTTEFDLLLQHGGIDIPRVISDLGSELIGSNADALTARVTVPFPTDSGGVEYTLIASFENASAEYNVRVYIAEDSALQQFPSLVITHNASWNGSVWSKDDATREAVRRDIGYSESTFYKRQFNVGGTWTDLQWDDGGTNSEKIHTLAQNNFLSGTDYQCIQWMCNGILGMQNVTTDAWASNLPGSSAPVANAIYAKNIVKAWGSVYTDGAGGFNYNRSFNGVATLPGTGRLLHTFGTAMKNLEYSVVAMLSPSVLPGAGTDPNNIWSWKAGSWNKTTTSFDIVGIDTTAAPNALWTNPGTYPMILDYIVLGEQDS
jgi:hypothetical protein